VAKDSDQSAGSFGTENTGGVLAGLLAEENAYDRRALWRIGAWGATAVAAVVVAAMTNQSSIGWRRDQLAAADLTRQAQQLQTVARESQNETRRLAAAIDTLNNDRDRLYSRVTVLETGLESVTGAIARQTSAVPIPATPVPPVTLPKTPLATPFATPLALPSTAAPAAPDPQPTPANQAAAPVIEAPVPAAVATTTLAPTPPVAAPAAAPDKPRMDVARLEPKSEGKTEPKIEPKAEAKTEFKHETKPEAKLEPKATKPEPKIESKPELKPEVRSKLEPESESKLEPKPRPRIEPRVEAKVEAKTESKAEPRAELKSETIKPETNKSEANKSETKESRFDWKTEKAEQASAPALPTPQAAPQTAARAPASAPPAASPPPAADAMASVTAKERDSAETVSTGLPVQRTEFAVELGGANSVNGLRALWRTVRSKPDLAALRPIIVIRESNTGLGMQLRLAAGPLHDAATAAKICATLVEGGRTCETAVFDGQRLAMSPDEVPPPEAKPALPASKSGPYRRSAPRPAFNATKKDEPPIPQQQPQKPEVTSTLSSMFGSSKH